MELIDYLKAGRLPDSPDEISLLLDKMTPEQKVFLMMEVFYMMQDIKQLKDAIVKTLGTIGIMNESGQIVDKINWKKLLGTVNGFMWNADKAAKDFEYLKALAPLVEKYKHL